MLLRMEDVYLAVLLHQLQRPSNIFRLDLQDRIEKAPDPKNVRFVSYSNPEYVFGCGVTVNAKKNGASADNGFNVYGRLLGKVANVLVEKQPIENPFLDELLSNKDLFKSIGQRSVLFLTDDQSELFTAVEGGDVLRESCPSWSGIGRSFTALATRLSQLSTEMCLYEAVILFCSPQFCSNIVWDGDHGLDEFATVLAQVVALWGPKISFVTPFAHPACPMDEKHLEFLMTKLGETGVKILDLTSNAQLTANENSTISSDTQLISRARFSAWRMICEALPRLLFIKFTPTPTLVDMKIQPVASESTTASTVKSPKAEVAGPIPATLDTSPPSICHEVDVVAASPLSRFYVHGDLDLKDRKVASIERAVEYLRLVHHGQPADHLFFQRWPLGTVDQSVSDFRHCIDQMKDFTINMNVIYRMSDVYFSVMLHQLERKYNPFRLALEAEIARAPDPKNIRFLAYGSNKVDHIMSVGGNLPRKLKGWFSRGMNLYGSFLDKLTKILVEGSSIENPFLTELLSNMTLFHPPKSKGVLFVGDKYSKLYDDIVGGDVFTVDGDSFVDFADFFTSGDLSLLEYDYILIFCGPKFVSEVDWKGNHGFDDFANVLTQLTALRGSETIAFLASFTTSTFPAVRRHVDTMVSRLDGTSVNCLTWGEENAIHGYTYLGTLDGTSYTTECRRRVWQKFCEVFPELRCVYLKFPKAVKSKPKAAAVQKVPKPSTTKKTKSAALVNSALIVRKAAIQRAWGTRASRPPSHHGYAGVSSVPRKTIKAPLLPSRLGGSCKPIKTPLLPPPEKVSPAKLKGPFPVKRDMRDNATVFKTASKKSSPLPHGPAVTSLFSKVIKPPKHVRVPRVCPSPVRIVRRRVVVASTSFESPPNGVHCVESKPSTSSRTAVRSRQSTSPEKMIPCGLRSLYTSKSPSRNNLDRRSGSPGKHYESDRQEPRRVIPLLDLHGDQSEDIGRQQRTTPLSGSTGRLTSERLKRPLSPGTRYFFTAKSAGAESDHRNRDHNGIRGKERSHDRRSRGSDGHGYRDKTRTRSPPRKRSRLSSGRRSLNSDRAHDRRSHASTERSDRRGSHAERSPVSNFLQMHRTCEGVATGRSGRHSNASADRSDASQSRYRSHRLRKNDRRSRDSLERPRSRCSRGSSRQGREYPHLSSDHYSSYFRNRYGSRDSTPSDRHERRHAAPDEDFYGADRHESRRATPPEHLVCDFSDDGGEQPILELFPRQSARL